MYVILITRNSRETISSYVIKVMIKSTKKKNKAIIYYTLCPTYC